LEADKSELTSIYDTHAPRISSWSITTGFRVVVVALDVVEVVLVVVVFFFVVNKVDAVVETSDVDVSVSVVVIVSVISVEVVAVVEVV
jgi:hypothetical protein